ncbi:MAG: RNA polymerase sigma factor [Anaerolinea sp.]|nr:RNA polymerase sigma factor [Anaerolinea sp.]
MTLIDDQHLIAQARDNPQAFAALYDRHVDRIYGYAYRLLQDDALAQDTTAVTFEKALRHLQHYEWQGKSFAAWLYRIAHNEAMSQHRKRKWLAPWPHWQGRTENRSTETAVLTAERHHQLHHALAQLSLTDRSVLTLRFFEELPTDDIAAILNCSKDTVYLRLHRALKRLQQHLIVNNQLSVFSNR